MLINTSKVKLPKMERIPAYTQDGSHQYKTLLKYISGKKAVITIILWKMYQSCNRWYQSVFIIMWKKYVIRNCFRTCTCILLSKFTSTSNCAPSKPKKLYIICSRDHLKDTRLKCCKSLDWRYHDTCSTSALKWGITYKFTCMYIV
jgi:hypothetical protein